LKGVVRQVDEINHEKPFWSIIGPACRQLATSNNKFSKVTEVVKCIYPNLKKNFVRFKGLDTVPRELGGFALLPDSY